ncbi:MAG: hypothetical protein D6746_13845, partial [Bacteroidetes bacterium]
MEDVPDDEALIDSIWDEILRELDAVEAAEAAEAATAEADPAVCTDAPEAGLPEMADLGEGDGLVPGIDPPRDPEPAPTQDPVADIVLPGWNGELEASDAPASGAEGDTPEERPVMTEARVPDEAVPGETVPGEVVSGEDDLENDLETSPGHGRSWPVEAGDAPSARAESPEHEAVAPGHQDTGEEHSATTKSPVEPPEGRRVDDVPVTPPAASAGVPLPDDVLVDPNGKPQKSSLKDRVVTALLWKRIVTPKQVAEAVARQKKSGERELLWRLVARIPGVDAERVYEEAARVYAFPVVEITPEKPDKEFVLLIMETVAEDRREELLKLHLLPYEYEIDPQNGVARLIFITHDPARPEVHRILQQLNLGRFELRYASRARIDDLIQELFPKKNEYLERISGDKTAYDLGTSYEDRQDGLIDEEALEAEIGRAPLINLFEATLVEAVRQGASDIHIFPNADRQIEIHFRVDGRLKRWYTEDKVHPEAFLAVVKDNSVNVDRFERDMAQDGFIQRWIDGALIRFRVSVLPIASAVQEIRAESIVIRVLDDRKVLTD